LDCDVEGPNCHLFLKPVREVIERVEVPVPRVDEQKCNACGKCGEICQFSAIVSLLTKPLVFPELCHSCGGCLRVCPEGAITEQGREVGTIELGRAGAVEFAAGRLRVGEAMAPPLIRAVKRYAKNNGLVILDAPPGTSCPVIQTVKGCDYVILVTEPTPFGLNDLKLAVEMVRELAIPFGVVVNRFGIGDDRVHGFCGDEAIPILLEIPDDRRIAEAYSRGELMVRALPEYRERLESLLAQIGGWRKAVGA
jgi:MinD superfamily P-loop ATPase